MYRSRKIIETMGVGKGGGLCWDDGFAYMEGGAQDA